jgi:hypothetical protein
MTNTKTESIDEIILDSDLDGPLAEPESTTDISYHKNRKPGMGIIAIAMATSMFFGCVGNTYNTRSPSADRIKYQEAAITHSGLDLDRYTRIDARLQVRDFADYLNFKKKYQEELQFIVNQLKNRKFDEVESGISGLAAKLERDGGVFAREQLDKVKNFHYFVYQATDTVQESTGIATDRLLKCIYFGVVFPGIGTALALWMLKEDKKEVLSTSYDKIKVTPYYKRAEVVEKNISAEKLRILMELNR